MIKKILLCLLLLQCTRAFAIEMTPDNLLNSLIHDFVQYALAEAEPIKNAARRLFFLLLPIAIVSSGIKNIFRDGSIQALYADIIMLVLFTGLYYFLLENGASIGLSIVDSMSSIIDSKPYGPSELVDMTFNLHTRLMENNSTSSFKIISILIMKGLMYLAVFLLLLVILRFASVFLCAHMLCIVGVFVLGFGAFSYTRNIAVNYLRTVFSVALELMCIILVVKSGCVIILDLIEKMEEYAESGKTIGSVEYLIVAFTALFIFMLSKSLPQMVGSLIIPLGNARDATLERGVMGAVNSIKNLTLRMIK